MYCYIYCPARLACLNHAASVHSEPGSNSPKRVQNLVIHELLRYRPKSVSHTNYIELLIGGPNQSHKVNFKEPLPLRERFPRRHFHFSPSILFPKILEISFGMKRPSFWIPSFALPDSARRVLRWGGGTCEARFFESSPI